jgi:hypothetical protein
MPSAEARDIGGVLDNRLIAAPPSSIGHTNNQSALDYDDSPAGYERWRP